MQTCANSGEGASWSDVESLDCDVSLVVAISVALQRDLATSFDRDVLVRVRLSEQTTRLAVGDVQEGQRCVAVVVLKCTSGRTQDLGHGADVADLVVVRVRVEGAHFEEGVESHVEVSARLASAGCR